LDAVYYQGRLHSAAFFAYFFKVQQGAVDPMAKDKKNQGRTASYPPSQSRNTRYGWLAKTLLDGDFHSIRRAKLAWRTKKNAFSNPSN